MKQAPSSLRWLVVCVFFLSSTLNYLDRLLLPALAPLIKSEFHLSYADYGLIVSSFSFVYAATAPFAGLLIDRIGLNAGISVAVALWSAATISMGFTSGLAGMIACQAWLGIAQAGGIPAAGKAIYQYLLPKERALGQGFNNVGIWLGAMLAAPLAAWIAVRADWRTAFIAAGAATLVWIPVWNLVARSAPVGIPAKTAQAGVPAAPTPLRVLRDPRMAGLLAANALSMVNYSLWSNWTTVYLVEMHHLTLIQAARFSWIPPLFAMLGGFAGGWLSLYWVNRNLGTVTARMRVCLLAAFVGLATAAIPLLPGAALSAAGISLSILAVSAFSVNVYSMPLDIFGGGRAAFATALLTSAYGFMQALVSPKFGQLIDNYGFAPICVAASITPLAGYAVLRFTRLRS